MRATRPIPPSYGDRDVRAYDGAPVGLSRAQIAPQMNEALVGPLRDQRVLVTGATGFTGGHLARVLVRAGCNLRAFVRNPDALHPDLRHRVEVAQGDIRDSQAVDAAVTGCDHVFHLAAIFRDASVRESVYTDVNATGTQHVLDACERHGVRRLVHCSTVGVHGHVSDVPADEDAPFNPGDEYQRSKLDAEMRVWDWFARTSIPTTVVRPAGIHGPGDLRFLKLFRGIKRGYFVMLGSGRTLYHVVFIDDAVQVFLRAAVADAAVGEAFHACGPRYVTLNKLVAIIAKVLGAHPPRLRLPVWPVYLAGALAEAVFVPLGRNPPLYRRRVDFFTHDRAFSIEKAQRLLGYEPQVDLEQGIRATARWYESQGLIPAP